MKKVGKELLKNYAEKYDPRAYLDYKFLYDEIDDALSYITDKTNLSRRQVEKAVIKYLGG